MANDYEQTINKKWETSPGSTFTPGSEKTQPLTLGGLIRDQRIIKGWSQMQVAGALGWTTQSARVAGIEANNGISRQVAEELALITSLDLRGRSVLLLLGKFLPSDQDILKTQALVQNHLDTSTTPMHVEDFGGRVLLWNERFMNSYGLADKEATIKKRTAFLFRAGT